MCILKLMWEMLPELNWEKLSELFPEVRLYRYRQKDLEEFYTMEGTLVACKDVDGLFEALNMSHRSDS